MRENMIARGVAALLVLLVAGAAAAPALAVQYRFDPQTTHVAPGQSCTVSVIADAAGDSLGCIECWIRWDPALVTLTSGQEGTLFKNAGSRLFFNHAIPPDTFSVEGCLLGYRTYTLTPGEVARFVFRASNQAGVCRLRIERFNLWDIDRNLFQPTHDPEGWIVIGTPTGASEPPPPGLTVWAYPNPFNPSTTVELRARAGERVRLDVYDSAGALVRCLFDGAMEGEVARVVWDGRDATGRRVPSGVYFAVGAGWERRATHKIVVVQ